MAAAGMRLPAEADHGRRPPLCPQVCDALEDMMGEGGVLVDYHGCDFFPERSVGDSRGGLAGWPGASWAKQRQQLAACLHARRVLSWRRGAGGCSRRCRSLSLPLGGCLACAACEPARLPCRHSFPAAGLTWWWCCRLTTACCGSASRSGESWVFSHAALGRGQLCCACF